MAHVPIPMTTLSAGPPPQSTSFIGRRSPMVCPLAKLGRSSPTMDHPRNHRSPSVEIGYRRSPLDPSVYSHLRGTPSPLEPSVYIHQFPPRIPDPLCYRNSGSSSPLKDGNQNYRNQKSFRNVNQNVSETSFRSFPGLMNESYFRGTNSKDGNFHSLLPSSEGRLNDQSPFRAPLSMVETSNSYQQRLINNTSLSSDNSRNTGHNEGSLYQKCLINQSLAQHDPPRCSPALRQGSSPTVEHPFLYQTTDLDSSYKIGRSSPSLDQGYHTLVSPNSGPSTPGPWTDYNPLSPTTTSSKGKKFSSNNKSSSSPFDKLPDEAIVKIFAWLDSSDLCICARVCKRWESLAWEPQLWRVIKLSGEHLCGDKAVRSVLRRLCGQGTTGACPTVERVLLSDGAKITDKGLTQLSRRCTELTHLQLHGCSAVTNNAIFELATKCTNLQHLDLTGCSRISCLSVTTGPEPPSRLLLQYLDLTDCSAVDDGGLKVIVRNCPQLVYLYLRRCVQITDTGIKFIPSFCSMLRELSVSDCNRVTDFGLHELAKLGATLRYLSVAKCDRVSDAGLKVIARRCYKLRYLNARGCEAVSDDAITVLARSCPRLRALDIGKCDVSDAGLRALAECCPNLKKLSLRNCDLVTDRGVQCIAYYCRGLQQLNIQDCQISIDGYRAVKKYCKRCVIEHTNPGFF